MIPGWPNGGTRPPFGAVTSLRLERTQGTETSQYLEEEESTEMPRVAASERGHLPKPALSGAPGL